MEIVNFAWGLCWKVLVIWMFVYFVKNIKEIMNTIGVALHTACHWVRKNCIIYLKKEAGEAEKPNEEVPVD